MDIKERAELVRVRSHPLNDLESVAAGKLTASGTDHYNAYWAIRNNRYDSSGRRVRRRRPQTSFRTDGY